MLDTRWHPTLLMRATFALHLLAVTILIVAPEQWPIVLGSVLANHVLLAVLGLWPRSNWLGANLTRLPAGAVRRNEVALTIDDGPDPEVTPRVLEMLDHYGARATFFCIGDKAQRYPGLCDEIVRRGHVVENHSQHHRQNFALLGYRGFRRELQAAQETLTGITCQRPLFFRAPAGLRNPLLDPVLVHLGLRLTSWSTRGFDTWIRTPERVQRRLLRGLRPGAILVLHDGNAACTRDGDPVILEVLPAVLASAAAAGLRFVTLRHALQEAATATRDSPVSEP